MFFMNIKYQWDNGNKLKLMVLVFVTVKSVMVKLKCGFQHCACLVVLVHKINFIRID